MVSELHSVTDITFFAPSKTGVMILSSLVRKSDLRCVELIAAEWCHAVPTIAEGMVDVGKVIGSLNSDEWHVSLAGS